MEEAICWQCGEPTASLFCPSCKTLQAPPSDYFRIFGLPAKLSIDAAELQKEFYALSRQLHPDRFGRKSEQERQYSVDSTAVLNDAYRVLRDPVQRAEYVLKAAGFDVAEQRGKDVPPELLEEVFELNMALEELREGDTSARSQLESARTNFVRMLQGIDGELTVLFRKYDEAPGQATLAPIRAVLNRRRYIQNLVREVEKELTPA